MRKWISLPITAILFSLACQFLAPARNGMVLSNCDDIVTAVRSVQPGAAPQHLLDTGVKNGSEFDANQYFTVLNHVSMRTGHLLDYVYVSESLGGSPLLYARPEDQAPYTSLADLPANTQLPDFHEYLDVEDVEQGYFEDVAYEILQSKIVLQRLDAPPRRPLYQ